MATKIDTKITWPDRLKIQGQLSFPLYSTQQIDEVAEWRVKKGHKAPQFPDKIGVTLALTQAQYDKARAYLTDVYLPFVDTLYKDTDGAKGIGPDLVKELLDQAKREVWIDEGDKKKRPNLPIRSLDDKDRKNLDEKFVAKLKVNGPYEEAPLERKALMKIGEDTRVLTIAELNEEGVLPARHTDPDKLWWGSGWMFRTSVRFNAFDSASVGVSAYADVIYLLPELGLPVGGGNTDAEMLEEGDDWDE